MKRFLGSTSPSQIAKSPWRWVPLGLIVLYILFAWSYTYGPFLQATSSSTGRPQPELSSSPSDSSPATSKPAPNGLSTPTPPEIDAGIDSEIDSEISESSLPAGSGYKEDILYDNGYPTPIESLPFVEPLPTLASDPEPAATSSLLVSSKTSLISSSTISTTVQPSQTFAFSEEEILRIPACSQISLNTLKALQKAKSPSVYTFYKGNLVAKGDTLSSPSKICILAAVPQKFPPAKLFPESPVPGKWPDTVHLSLGSDSVRFSIPHLRPLPAQPNAHRLFSTQAILYFTEVELTDGGVYHIDAENEAPNWLWAMHGWREASQEIRDANQEILKAMRGLTALANFTASKEANKLLLKPVAVSSTRKFPADIVVSGPPQRPDVPSCCNASEIDLNKGRWFRQSKYPSLRKETADEQGFSFDLDDCHLDYFDAKDAIDCLSNKRIHIFGDSNGRRLSRAILSGNRWCHDIDDRCQGEDNGLPVKKVTLDKSGKVVEKIEPKTHKMQFEIGDQAPFMFGRGSKLWFTFLTSVAYEPRQWLGKFYTPAQFKIPARKPKEGPKPFMGEYLLPGAHARSPFASDTADIVIISMSSWDDAFDVEYRAYERTLAYFRDAILEAYPNNSTQLFLRLNQGYCCRRNFRPANLRRFTGTRLQHFSDIARRVFQVEGALAMQGRMRVIDAGALTGRPEVVRAYSAGQLSNNHQRAAHVRTEAQVLFNSVCKRNALGKAEWKS